MASGRPRRPNDPSIMASVEAAVSSVSRAGLPGRLWHWRYELALMTGLPLAALAVGYTLGLDWLIAMAAAALAGLAAVLLSWLAYIPRRRGDHLFSWNDTEAYWRGWQITKVHGGFGRRYRDPRFDALTACPQCRGGGVNTKDGADTPCVPCLGTGRVSTEEVS